jgi:hypothetical protein
MRYSQTTHGFYPEEIAYTSLPIDLITITDIEYNAAMNLAPGESLNVVGGVLVIVPASLSFFKAQQDAILDAAYKTAITSDITFGAGSNVFAMDILSQLLLTQILVTGSVLIDFKWNDINNIQVSMTFVEMQNFSSLLFDRNQGYYLRLQARKASVNEAATQVDIESVIW